MRRWKRTRKMKEIISLVCLYRRMQKLKEDDT